MTTRRPTWDQIFAKQRWGRYPNELVVREVMAAKALFGRQRSAIDLGCGGGAHTLMLLQEGFSVIGIDSSQGALDQARDHCLSVNREISSQCLLHKYDYIRNPYNGLPTSLILDWLSLTHASRPVIEKVARRTLALLPSSSPGVYILGLFGDKTDPAVFTDRPKCTCYRYTEARDLGRRLSGWSSKYFRMEEMTYTRKGVLVQLFCLVFTSTPP
jgi:SAM-dependent methyltransferase